MTRPSLTFACELDAARLTELFADGSVIDKLKALGARVMIMVSDFSAERARIVRQLNQAGIPLVGIPLFPVEEGYYFTVDNAPGSPTATSSGSSGQPSTGWSGTGSGWTLNPRPSSTCS